jgi:hypothetical protein
MFAYQGAESGYQGGNRGAPQAPIRGFEPKHCQSHYSDINNIFNADIRPYLRLDKSEIDNYRSTAEWGGGRKKRVLTGIPVTPNPARAFIGIAQRCPPMYCGNRLRWHRSA